MLRPIAFILNCMWVFVSAIILIDGMRGFELEGTELLIFALLSLTSSTLNVIAIKAYTPAKQAKDLVGVFLQAKKLEQELKIKELEKKKQEQESS